MSILDRTRADKPDKAQSPRTRWHARAVLATALLVTLAFPADISAQENRVVELPLDRSELSPAGAASELSSSPA